MARKADLPAENTLPALEFALANGCDGFEFDVRGTRDGRCVLCHDPKLKGVVLAETDFTELCLVCGEPLPCLEDVLAGFGDRAYLDIELKQFGNESAVVAALKTHPPQRGYLVSSFDPRVQLRVHELDASIPLGYLCDHKKLLARWRDLPVSVVLPEYPLVSQTLIKEVHAVGKQVFTWTVNREPNLAAFAEWGVDGLISDDPKLLSRVFAGWSLPTKPQNQSHESREDLLNDSSQRLKPNVFGLVTAQLKAVPLQSWFMRPFQLLAKSAPAHLQ